MPTDTWPFTCPARCCDPLTDFQITLLVSMLGQVPGTMCKCAHRIWIASPCHWHVTDSHQCPGLHLQEPLLIPDAAQPPPTAPQGANARRPPSAPVRRPALPQSIGSMPFLARSVRLFPHMFSPHSLASPPMDGAHLASPSDEDYASSVHQQQRWPGTTPSQHPGGVLRAPIQGNAMTTSVQSQLEQQGSNASTVESPNE